MKILLILLVLIIFSSCTIQDEVIMDSNIKPNENVSNFSEMNFYLGGCYYGSLDQKAPGTPDDWIHLYEGTRSASWCPPN